MIIPKFYDYVSLFSRILRTKTGETMSLYILIIALGAMVSKTQVS